LIAQHDDVEQCAALVRGQRDAIFHDESHFVPRRSNEKLHMRRAEVAELHERSKPVTDRGRAHGRKTQRSMRDRAEARAGLERPPRVEMLRRVSDLAELLAERDLGSCT
jgi:hypothetical protein